ncbi:hypothetical protein DL1_11565 [Thioclava dalianensis]|uniref:DUF2793 domain-containing protein n=1 Tax=Thioclava dalianensis TaxID=1185766 RepID=A0A074TE86_9RHOB|nr:DUF2793 domain-containing protein [Thioclava dalianensis]KEP68490.1 hypothetical protein DL1_11565 [Thioclava dalianensis]SFN34397.1 Protein of unknown function [Thioclava dalianensis]
MSDSSPRLGLPFLLPSQAQKHVTHNEALQRLDLITQLVLEARAAEMPPVVPQVGQIHALSSSPQGDWAGKGGMLAQWSGEDWVFLAPMEGWRGWDRATETLCVFTDGVWEELGPDLQNLAGVGVGTQSDATNRLAVASDASLFTHAGSDHRVKLNKAASADTASLLYQSSWTGHAEVGLAGDNDLHIKVSADGSTWTEALRVDAATGRLNGAAIQQSASDTADGRLMAVGAFGLGASTSMPIVVDADNCLSTGFWSGTPGSSNLPLAVAGILRVWRSFDLVLQEFTTGAQSYQRQSEDGGASWQAWKAFAGVLLGPVSQAAGQSTGAVIERGANGNGAYTRLADGTQSCWTELDAGSSLALGTGSRSAPYRTADFDWDFPMAFVAPPSVTAVAVVDAAGPERLHFVSLRSVSASGVVQGSAVRFSDATTPASVTVQLCATGRWV